LWNLGWGKVTNCGLKICCAKQTFQDLKGEKEKKESIKTANHSLKFFFKSWLEVHGGLLCRRKTGYYELAQKSWTPTVF